MFQNVKKFSCWWCKCFREDPFVLSESTKSVSFWNRTWICWFCMKDLNVWKTEPGRSFVISTLQGVFHGENDKDRHKDKCEKNGIRLDRSLSQHCVRFSSSGSLSWTISHSETNFMWSRTMRKENLKVSRIHNFASTHTQEDRLWKIAPMFAFSNLI